LSTIYHVTSAADWEAGRTAGEYTTSIRGKTLAAARRRFPPGWSNADVIRFVGQLRARNQGEQSDVDSGVAEQMLYSALRGEPMGGQFGEFAKGYAQFVLLAELVSDLDARQIDAFLEEARERADRWLAGQTCP
jgi:hypothetical protein